MVVKYICYICYFAKKYCYLLSLTELIKSAIDQLICGLFFLSVHLVGGLVFIIFALSALVIEPDD